MLPSLLSPAGQAAPSLSVQGWDPTVKGRQLTFNTCDATEANLRWQVMKAKDGAAAFRSGFEQTGCARTHLRSEERPQLHSPLPGAVWKCTAPPSSLMEAGEGFKLKVKWSW